MVEKNMTDEKNKLAAQEKSKILKRLGHISRELNKLSSKMSRLKDVEDMTDYEVIEALQKSRQWGLSY